MKDARICVSALKGVPCTKSDCVFKHNGFIPADIATASRLGRLGVLKQLKKLFLDLEPTRSMFILPPAMVAIMKEVEYVQDLPGPVRGAPPPRPRGAPRGAPSPPRRGSSKVCSFYLKGTCTKGSNCRFSHAGSATAPKKCTYFLKGKCSKGDECKFSHAIDITSPPAE